MTLIQALILGAIQGLTEFFPISSSAHLKLGRYLMGIEQEGLIYFDLVCHAGTLAALLIYLRSEIGAALRDKKTRLYLILGLTPLLPAYFLLKPLRSAASNPMYLGYFLFITSLFLFLASKKQSISFDAGRPKWKSVLCIGLVQTMALLPGISRSGSTIAAARLLGWDWLSAARFSFLLAIPTILGGQLMETVQLIRGHEILNSIAWPCYLAGFAASFGLGMVGVRFVFRFYELGIIRPFAWYCLGAAIAAWLAFHG
jgi:undecaprenyl-diphosphatase